MTQLVSLPFQLQPATLQQLLADAQARELLFTQTIEQFEHKYKMSLETLEQRLEQGKYPEHPAWEDSIEWRNAVEQFNHVQITRSILSWLNNSLAQ